MTSWMAVTAQTSLMAGLATTSLLEEQGEMTVRISEEVEFEFNSENSNFESQLKSSGNDLILDFNVGEDNVQFDFEENSVADIAEVNGDTIVQFKEGSVALEGVNRAGLAR